MIPMDEYVKQRRAELYPELCERYAELKELMREILSYYVGMSSHDIGEDKLLTRAWDIAHEDGD